MIFSEKTLRALLIAGSSAVSLLLWIFSASALVQNFSLKMPVAAKVLQWEVEEVKSDRYALRARYIYELEGKPHSGETLFRPVYLNEFSAIEGLKAAARLPWTAWVNPCCPGRSSLEKLFPLGLILRALISTFVALYFILVYRRKYFKLDCL